MVRQQGGSETAAKLGKLSRELYLSLGEELGLDSGFRETGYYIVAETEEEKEGFLRLIDVRREAGVENEWVEPEEGRRRFPDLAWDRFVGATYTADDGYVHPPIAARNATCAVLSEEAVDLFEMCEVLGIEERGEHYAVETVRGPSRRRGWLTPAGRGGRTRLAPWPGWRCPSWLCGIRSSPSRC